MSCRVLYADGRLAIEPVQELWELCAVREGEYTVSKCPEVAVPEHNVEGICSRHRTRSVLLLVCGCCGDARPGRAQAPVYSIAVRHRTCLDRNHKTFSFLSPTSSLRPSNATWCTPSSLIITCVTRELMKDNTSLRVCLSRARADKR